jgi:flagellar biosynthesis protein FliR
MGDTLIGVHFVLFQSGPIRCLFSGVEISLNTAPTMGTPMCFYTNAAENVVLHMKNGATGLIRATFVYVINQDYIGSGKIIGGAMGLKFSDVDASGTVTDRTRNTELLCYLVILQ